MGVAGRALKIRDWPPVLQNDCNGWTFRKSGESLRRPAIFWLLLHKDLFS